MKFEFLNKAILFEDIGKKNQKILVLGDLHIGWEEALNEQGVFLPRLQFKEIMKELREIFSEIGKRKLDKIIVLGDLKHEFGTISMQEWRELGEILDFFKKKTKQIILVKGNHDTILGPIAKRKELEIKDYFVIEEEGICFLHGHKFFSECLDKKIKMLVLGHRHPAVVIADKYKKEKYKCFLVGKWKRKKVIILPSFFPFVEGSDIVQDYEQNRLFIQERKLRKFEVNAVSPDGKVLKFGGLKGII